MATLPPDATDQAETSTAPQREFEFTNGVLPQENSCEDGVAHERQNSLTFGSDSDRLAADKSSFRRSLTHLDIPMPVTSNPSILTDRVRVANIKFYNMVEI
jgi:hypothetical protein